LNKFTLQSLTTDYGKKWLLLETHIHVSHFFNAVN
jgi:hypothetical protein